MTRRAGSAAFAFGAATASVLLSSLMLSGCAPGADPTPSPTPTPTSASATPAPVDDGTDAGLALPPGALLGVAATATADNGAVLDVILTAGTPSAWDAPESADATAAILANCSGEVDATVLASGSYRLIELTVTVTPRAGAAWPAELPLPLLPAAADGILLTASEGTAQYSPSAQEDGDYVPHCRQTGMLPGPATGPASGTFLVGFDGGRGWPAALFGFGPQELAGVPTPVRLTFSDCRATASPDGAALVGTVAVPDPAAPGSCAATTTGS